jgi:hypothetical protein
MGGINAGERSPESLLSQQISRDGSNAGGAVLRATP